jgi:hypothetical protein
MREMVNEEFLQRGDTGKKQSLTLALLQEESTNKKPLRQFEGARSAQQQCAALWKALSQTGKQIFGIE